MSQHCPQFPSSRAASFKADAAKAAPATAAAGAADIVEYPYKRPKLS